MDTQTRLSSGSSAFRTAASRSRAAERGRLGGISARSRSGGVQAAQGGLAVWCDPSLLTDLAALDLRETDLAYLAACQTAFGDLRLLDEALHLAGALQLVGYRHVLATLWYISDAAAPTMADVTYAYLVHRDPGHPSPPDKPSADRAAHTLHYAVTRLRQTFPGEPMLWAPYIHLGP
jgi:hypothetical protein